MSADAAHFRWLLLDSARGTATPGALLMRCVCICGLLAGPVSTQGFVLVQTVAGEADEPQAVVAADVDGDGDLDVLSASEDDDKVAWYENLDGAGSFGPQILISSSVEGAIAISTADLDGDGDEDVLAAAAGGVVMDRQVVWFENTDGSGAFGPKQVIGMIKNPVSVETLDADRDGDRDVLVADRGDDQVVWFANDGQGGFGPKQIVASGFLSAISAKGVDFDGDGDEDVVAASLGGGEVAWFENLDGQGAFGPGQQVSALVTNASSVTGGDLNGDGDPDVVIGSWDLVWHQNVDGRGTFGPEQPISPPLVGARSVVVLDQDGDGDQDVLADMWVTPNDRIAWYGNEDGLGGFTVPLVITTSAQTTEAVFGADIDGDGDLDALSASSKDDKVAWYRNIDGQGGYGAQQPLVSSAPSVISVLTGDIDGDGDRDLLAASGGDNKLAWFENTDGQGAFGLQQVITTSAVSVNDAQLADLDGDGDLDALSGDSNDVAWYENSDGLGAFGPPQVLEAFALDVCSVFSSDLDGDGDEDILATTNGPDRIVGTRTSEVETALGPSNSSPIRSMILGPFTRQTWMETETKMCSPSPGTAGRLRGTRMPMGWVGSVRSR